MSVTSICPLISVPSVFRDRRGPELLFCIVMCLLSLWWGGKFGWQLFLKPERVHSRGGGGDFLQQFFPPSPICKRLYYSLPLFSASTSLVRRQETKLPSITKSSRAVWSPVSASRPPAQQHRGALRAKWCWIQSQKGVSTKRDREDLFNWRSCCPHLWNRIITEEESFGRGQNE